MPTHVFDFTESPAPAAPMAALFGNEPLLKSLARQHLHEHWGQDADLHYLDGDKKSGVTWRDVRDELATRSLFGGGRRVVWIRDADDFVSENRGALEKYADAPASSGALVLELGSFPANTKLYKKFDKIALMVDCRVPTISRGRGKPANDTKKVAQWLCTRAKSAHDCDLPLTAAQAMIELIGLELGLLDQELARLALFAKPGETLSAKQVRSLCGGWRNQTAWDLIDAMLAGDSADAMRLVDQLLRAGEAPIAMLGQISWTLRRFATAARLLFLAKKNRERLNPQAALKQAGFPPYRLSEAEAQLKHIGAARSQELMDWIVASDMALKGTHSSPSRSRDALESLVLKLSQPPKAVTA